VPEAYVLETLRTARTKASPRGGFAGISPVDLLVTLQRELVARTGLDPGRIQCASGIDAVAQTAARIRGQDLGEADRGGAAGPDRRLGDGEH
jgi:acetyl-CoA C-acetyltransferase